MEEPPIRNVPNDYKDPTLRRWRVIEVVLKNGACSRHVFGHDVTNGAGRASSAINEFDVENMIATTQSGRQYRLIGVPGTARRGEYVWQNWCSINGVVSERDVTAEYFSADKFFHMEPEPGDE